MKNFHDPKMFKCFLNVSITFSLKKMCQIQVAHRVAQLQIFKHDNPTAQLCLEGVIINLMIMQATYKKILCIV